MNNSVLRKSIEYVKKNNRNIKIVRTEKKKELLNTRTKLSHCKAFHRKFFG